MKELKPQHQLFRKTTMEIEIINTNKLKLSSHYFSFSSNLFNIYYFSKITSFSFVFYKFSGLKLPSADEFDTRALRQEFSPWCTSLSSTMLSSYCCLYTDSINMNLQLLFLFGSTACFTLTQSFTGYLG